MAVSSVDSSKATSDDLKKQIMEQTSTLAEAAPEPEVVEEEETVEVEGLPEEESTEEETAKAETTEEISPKKEPLHKIVVEGKEEELTLDKLKEYAQKGRYLERERAKDKAEKERLQTTTGQQPFQMPDPTKINEQFVESLQKDTFGTMVQFYKTARELEKQQEKAERKADLDFESDKRELPHFREVKSSYDEFRDRGYDRETAWAMAERDFWMDYAMKAKEKGVNEGSKKVKLQAKAQIAVGEKKVKKEGSLPSPEEAKKMTSDQLAKYMRRIKGEW
jgi:hypothetical protein